MQSNLRIMNTYKMDQLGEEVDTEKVYLGNSYSEFAQLGDKLDGNPAKCKNNLLKNLT